MLFRSSGLLLPLLATAHMVTICPTTLPTSLEIAAELGSILSPYARVILPADTEAWNASVSRSSRPRIDPDYLAIVEVGNEKDIQHVVRYANAKNLPFFAVSTGHAWTSSINNIKNGIQISMRNLQNVFVSSNGKTATLGGGTTQNTTLKALAKVYKRAVTGLCECTYVIGPLLGGGHSLLQGQYGFSADNLVSARLVLANGTAITVSEKENSDLFWAIRGAGHNFGIVVSFEVKVYEIPDHFWTLTILTFPRSALEAFFETWNNLEDTYQDTGGLLLLHGLFNRNATHPILTLLIVHEGQPPIADTYISTFIALGTLTFTQNSNIPWEKIHDEMGSGSKPVCDMLNTNFFTTSTGSLRRWNAMLMRRCFEMYEKFTEENQQFKGSFWLLESYGRGRSQEAPVTGSAVAEDERLYHLVPAVTLWWEGDDVEDREKAEGFARLAKKTMQEESSARHTYVNYAVGGEDLEEMYGYDKTRLQKLQVLKQEWDPENKFEFNAPLL